MAPPSAISSWTVPSWSVVLPAFGVVLLLTLACRRRGLPLPPRTLPLLATVSTVAFHLVPLTLVPASSRLWLAIGVDLLLVLALIRLLLWLVLELPGGLEWWRPPPELLVQLLLVAGGALAAVLLVNRVGRLDVVGLVTTSAVLTAVVGLAIQEPLKDLIAGLELQLSDDLRLGDLVEIAGGQARGRVESLSWRDTTLRTAKGVRVVLPNTQVTNGILRNLSFSGAVSDCFDVGLDYDFPPAAALALLERVVTNHPLVLQEPPAEVRVKAFADSAITYEVQVWFREPSDGVRLNLRSALLQQIWYALNREGRSIPFPVRELQRRRPDPVAEALVASLPPQEGRLLLASHSLFADLPPADLDSLAGLIRDHRMGFAPGPPLHLSADLHPGGNAGQVHADVQGHGRRARLRGHRRPAGLVGAGVCGRDRRDRPARGAAPHRELPQQVPAHAQRDAAAARLSVAQVDDRRHEGQVSHRRQTDH
jgi:small-conductance mechanosensitive channel